MKTLIFLSLLISAKAMACMSNSDCGQGSICTVQGCQRSYNQENQGSFSDNHSGFTDKRALKFCSTQFDCPGMQSCIKGFGESRGTCQ